MITLKLKFPCPRTETTSENQNNTMFTLPPQGEPGMLVTTRDSLQRLSEQIRQRLAGVVTLVCHPHRVGLSSCVAVTLVGKSQQTVNILITVSGQESWPLEEEYSHPRWYITVTDAADMLYLVLWLNSIVY